MAETGSRPSEIIALKWRDIELSEGPHFYIGGLDDWTPKSENSIRKVPLTQQLAEEIAILPKKSDWLFPNKTNNGPRDNFRKALASACARAGIMRNGKLLKMTPKLF